MVLDFISPENVTECIQLTDEVRQLPEDHKAKIDKLEVVYLTTQLFASNMFPFEELGSY